MNYCNIKDCDIADGTGVRVSLFVSGCRHHCPGCFQKETWDFQYGQPFTDETADTILKLLSPDYIEGLTLLGGEPFEPENQEVLTNLLRRVRRERPDKNVWCYTGCILEKDLLTGKELLSGEESLAEKESFSGEKLSIEQEYAAEEKLFTEKESVAVKELSTEKDSAAGEELLAEQKPLTGEELPTEKESVLGEDLSVSRPYRTPFTDEMLSLIDVLVDGPFIEAKKNLSLAFKGSENQRIINLGKYFERTVNIVELMR